MSKTVPRFSKIEQECTRAVVVKVKKQARARVLTTSALLKLLNEKEAKLVRKVLALDPSSLGFKGPFLGTQTVPNTLIILRGQKYVHKKKTRKVPTQYLPKIVHAALKKFNVAFYSKLKKKLLVESGYRSPAYQVVVFLHYLCVYGFDVQKTARRVALPGYSEHGLSQHTAVDFIGVRPEYPVASVIRPTGMNGRKLDCARGGVHFFQQKSPGAAPREPWRPVLRTHGDRRGGLFYEQGWSDFRKDSRI